MRQPLLFDSSRFWQLASYEARFKKGEEPQYFDKEFLRLWFKEHCDPYKDETLPDAPAELVEELSRRYSRCTIKQQQWMNFGSGAHGRAARRKLDRKLGKYCLLTGQACFRRVCALPHR